MSTGTQRILDLDAELLDLEITYKDTAYKLRSRAELSILELRKFSAMLHEYDDLTSIEDGDEENAIKIGESLQKIADTLVVNPPDGGFPEQFCAAILTYWSEEHQKAAGPPTRRRAPQDRKPKQTRKPRSTGAR